MEFRQALFWDTDPTRIDVEKNAPYIIERILDFGRDSEVRWMYQTYPKPLIRSVVDNPRMLRPRTKRLWSLILK